MNQHSDLFPDFDSRSIETSAGRIFARTGGNGPPLLLLHGYPQTHVMWHRIAATLAKRFTLVVPDLPGYGSSDIPATDAEHTPYTKRAMARVMVEVMEKQGYSRFALVGHDRGGRVAYRLALDQPERLSRLAVLDILPTYDYWAQLDRQSALRIFHWTFLAQPYPVPETLISKSSDDFFGPAFAKGFDTRAVRHYLDALRDPARVHAICEDYRAGAYADFEHDKADRAAGRKIVCPLFVAWGSRGIASATATPLETWKTWATDARILRLPSSEGNYHGSEKLSKACLAVAEQRVRTRTFSYSDFVWNRPQSRGRNVYVPRDSQAVPQAAPRRDRSRHCAPISAKLRHR